MGNFEQAMKFVLKYEGGYNHVPGDAGGETNYGISDRGDGVVDGRSKYGTPIKDLTLEEALSVYRIDYWDAYNLDSQPLPLCVAMMDAYVQHRPSVVRKLIDAGQGSWKEFNAARRLFYLRLIDKNPSQIKFKRGWMNRMNDLDKYCTILEETPTV